MLNNALRSVSHSIKQTTSKARKANHLGLHGSSLDEGGAFAVVVAYGTIDAGRAATYRRRSKLRSLIN